MHRLASALLACLCVFAAFTVEASAQPLSCADILTRPFDVRFFSEHLETENLKPRTQKKLKKILTRFSKLQATEKKRGSNELESFSRDLFTLIRQGKQTPEEAVYTLAQQALLKEKLVQEFAAEGRLDESRLKNRIAGLFANAKFRRLTDTTFLLWFFPEIRTVKLSEELLDSIRRTDSVQLDAKTRKMVSRRLMFTRLKSYYLKFMTVFALGSSGLKAYETYAQFRRDQALQEAEFESKIMKPLREQVERFTNEDLQDLGL